MKAVKSGLKATLCVDVVGVLVEEGSWNVRG